MKDVRFKFTKLCSISAYDVDLLLNCKSVFVLVFHNLFINYKSQLQKILSISKENLSFTLLSTVWRLSWSDQKPDGLRQDAFQVGQQRVQQRSKFLGNTFHNEKVNYFVKPCPPIKVPLLDF